MRALLIGGPVAFLCAGIWAGSASAEPASGRPSGHPFMAGAISKADRTALKRSHQAGSSHAPADRGTAALLPRRPTSQDVITIVLVGDTGFNGSMEPVTTSGGRKHGRTIPFETMTRGVGDLISGDLNFANLETVITDQNSIGSVGKAFNFRSHPAGIAYLVDELGFNLFSLANNHAVDFGRAGMEDTLDQMRRLKGPVLGYAGLGRTGYEAASPATFEFRGRKFALSAIGIGATSSAQFHPKDGRVGQLPYDEPTFRRVSERLSEEAGAFKMLSVHAGLERRVRPLDQEVKRFRDIAARGDGIDVVVGHHAHVVQGVQTVNGSVIFYGLGNFMHPGMQNMGRFDRCRDYGLVAKLHVLAPRDTKPRVAAIEAIALIDMHAAPRQASSRDGRQRIAVLNGLASALDDQATGAKGVRFGVRADGSGLYCAPMGGDLPGDIGRVCRAWATKAPVDLDETPETVPDTAFDRAVVTLASTPDLDDLSDIPAYDAPSSRCGGVALRTRADDDASGSDGASGSTGSGARRRSQGTREAKPRRGSRQNSGSSASASGKTPAWMKAVLGQ